ncbi:Serine/threonine-protein kinase STE11 [Spathaspora sp. JA1]|nr:Serine/threonine-protein kinase STE11 [Spathaspora sp. JA1]
MTETIEVVETKQSDQKSDAKELKQWLANSNCQQYYSKFVDNGITMDLLSELDTEALKELEITKLGDRLRLELAISSMKQEKLQQSICIDDILDMVNNPIISTPVTGTDTGEATLTQMDSNNNNLSSSTTAFKDSSKNITFILQDGSLKRVNVSGCFNAQSIKRKVLKKLGFKSQEAQFDTYIHNTNSDNQSNVTLLFDVELVTICFSPERLEKHRIMFVPKNDYPTEAAIETSMKIMHKFTSRSEETNIRTRNQRSALRNFFGQRPPSELISSNLAEYFPEARKKDLEQTVRNSVRHSVRLSKRFNIPTGALSSSSIFSKRNSVLSTSTGLNSQRAVSISSVDTLNGLKRGQRTIGDVMMNNISAIDEAVNSADTFSFVPPSNQSTDVKSSSSSAKSHGRNALHRISMISTIPDTALSNRLSTIELVNSDSEEDDNDDENYDEFDSDEILLHSFDVPTNWVKGARIGSGSFGTVYLGMNPHTGELMAVKQIPLPTENNHHNTDIERSMAEQQREMTLLKELDHENIVRYFGSTTDESFLNIFLEYVPGGSVQSMLNSYGPFEEPLIRNFIRQVLIGLNYLHGEDIIHRDIKGANILIDIKGTVKIGDFGISRKVSSIDEEDEMFKKTGRRASLQGSVFWMAPEVVKQTVYTKKADIWSVGCLIVEMFTGRHPFPDLSQMQALFRIGSHIPPQIPEWCTQEAKDFLTETFELNYEMRPDAIDLLGETFLNTLIMSKQ